MYFIHSKKSSMLIFSWLLLILFLVEIFLTMLFSAAILPAGSIAAEN